MRGQLLLLGPGCLLLFLTLFLLSVKDTRPIEERRSSRRMAGVLTYEMGILVWDPEDEPAAGAVTNATKTTDERTNATKQPVENLARP